jgi:hypothetical protein
MNSERIVIIVGCLVVALALIKRGFSLRARFKNREVHLQTSRPSEPRQRKLLEKEPRG